MNLAVLDTGQGIGLDQFVPRAHWVKSVGWGRWHMPLHCTAAGKVLPANLRQDELEQTLPLQLERFTPHTITAVDDFLRELERVRQRGYACTRGELQEGLNAIAAPIYDYLGQVPSAANVAGPAYRVTPERFSTLAAQLMEATTRISGQLGYKPG